MSEAPDPGIIVDTVSSFDQGTSPDAFLEKSLSAIPARIPQARFARVYRLHEGKAVLQAASDTEQPAGVYRHVHSTPVYAEVVKSGTPAMENRIIASTKAIGKLFLASPASLEGARLPDLLNYAIRTALVADLVRFLIGVLLLFGALYLKSVNLGNPTEQFVLFLLK